jgi:hypothetical protein
MARLADLQR